MTDLERFAQYTLSNGGTWYELESCEKGSYFKTQRWHLIDNNYYGDSPIYQVFDGKGRRLYTSMDYLDGLGYYRNYVREMEK